MRKLTFIASLLLAIFLTNCTGNSYEKLGALEWMLGNWQGRTPEGLIFSENWERAGANGFTGKGLAISPQGDTVFRESLRIDLIEGVPYYIATVPENPGPVLFKMFSDKDQVWIFENKEHDFPQRIIYKLEKQNLLTVRLEGIEKGRPKREELSFQKQ
ncbi:MAG: DUF6265 family protein [Bacteroidia bacterium]